MASEREATFKEVVSNHSQKEKSLAREIEELRGQLDQVRLIVSFGGLVGSVFLKRSNSSFIDSIFLAY